MRIVLHAYLCYLSALPRWGGALRHIKSENVSTSSSTVMEEGYSSDSDRSEVSIGSGSHSSSLSPKCRESDPEK